MNHALLKEERVKRGITQETMAKQLGFKDKSSYCLMEKGKTSISVDVANKIIAVLDLSKTSAYNIFFTPEVKETSINDLILSNEGDTENV